MEKMSIRNLERRYNYTREATKLTKLLVIDRVFYDSPFNYSVLDLLDNLIPDLPFNHTSLDLETYFDDLDLTFLHDDSYIHKDSILAFISLWYNAIFFIPNSMKLQNKTVTDSIGKIIQKILDDLNYKTEILEPTADYQHKETILLKRDVDVDSVLEISTADERIWLLSYLDFRVENDYEHKVQTIRHLYTIFEQNRTDYKQLNKKLTSATGNIMNIIRHKQIYDYLTHEIIDMCDKAFYMYIQLKRTPLINEYIDYSNGLNVK